jgi:hypothetical protein
VTRPFGAIHAASRGWHELVVLLVERCHLENQKDVVINPELKTTEM